MKRNDPHESDVLDRVLARIDVKVARRKSRRRQRRAVIAVAAALLLAAGSWWHRGSLPVSVPSLPASAVASFPTTRTLPDGSTVELRDGAAISVQFSASIRQVTLERGEALFQVTKNPKRPFVVVASVVSVRAVGTAFAVELKPERVGVFVTEGRVSVDRAEPATTAAAAVPPTLVSAGNCATVDLDRRTRVAPAAPRVFAASAVELDDLLSWRAPKLEFTRTPLTAALPIFNRYNRAQLVLGDPALGGVQLSGILRANNLDTLFRLLATEYGIAAERRSDLEIVLRRAR